jgi:hypothetical protein
MQDGREPLMALPYAPLLLGQHMLGKWSICCPADIEHQAFARGLRVSVLNNPVKLDQEADGRSECSAGTSTVDAIASRINREMRQRPVSALSRAPL